ncbi:MAG TPA: helicase C-terminal domain-containing protein [Vicinamibacterales bacterium]
MPEVPSVPRATGLLAAVDAAFSRRGALGRVVDGYEARDGQRRMAAAVAAVIERGGTLLAEAGTGTGKTLAYLIPAILSRQRVLVSTGTKNLQEQIFFKDLPALKEALGVPFKATLMKGRNNYLCLHRWETYQQSQDSFERSMFVPIIKEWAAATPTGDRAELGDLPEDVPLWKEINADAETCLGSECPRWGDCWVTLMRQRAAESDVVIVNHHLLCADASVRRGEYGEVIPSCPTLVVDEAHQLEDVATQYFGLMFSNYRVDDLLRDCERLLASRPFGDRDDEVRRELTRVGERSRMFFAGLSMARVMAGATGGSESRLRYTAEAMAEHGEGAMMLAGTLESLESTFALLRSKSSEPGANPDVTEAAATLQRRAGELRTDLRFLMRADDSNYVYYLEMRGRGIFLRASPIDVSRIVREALFARMRATVLTSATLAVDGSFTYLKGRLGIGGAAEVRVASEFDYTRQALLYLPRRMPPPKAPSFAEAAARETIELLTRSRGRAFVLFTSYAVLRSVQRFVEMAVPYPVFVQGTAPRSTLIEQFRSTPSAVLLATSSFWQGVDVVGDALSCVIIDKLPFASPGEPITAARIESVNASGGDAFADYQVPLAILALQQGLGRLIRHRTDRGVLAVLDPRLRTMGYGRRFLESLPPAPITHDLDAVERFFM